LIAVIAFLIVVELLAEPITIVSAAPSTLALVTVVLSKLNVVTVVVISPPLTARSPPIVKSKEVLLNIRPELPPRFPPSLN
jgi:hypothetical protein